MMVVINLSFAVFTPLALWYRSGDFQDNVIPCLPYICNFVCTGYEFI